MLETVRKAGLKLLADTRNRVVGGQKLSSLDAFVVDVQMMIQADHYMSWGKSAVRSFVERARVQRAKNVMDELKKKKEREDDAYADELEALIPPVHPEKPTEPNKIDKPSPISTYEMQSVGRVYFNLTKPELKRWRKFNAE